MERFSRQRELVLKVVKDTKCHPDAEWIYNRVRESMPNISLGTVYRNLKSLSISGELLTMETEKNKIHYDGDMSAHSHFICRKCGRILDVFDDRPPSQEASLAGEVENQKTVYYGVCTECGIS